MRGHLLALVDMIPFSTLKLSIGSPAMFQALMTTGSPRVATNENCLEHGIPLCVQIPFQDFAMASLKTYKSCEDSRFRLVLSNEGTKSTFWEVTCN